MTQQYTPNLGQLAGDDARRDAVHIAVAPVMAGQDLVPGQHVGFGNSKDARTSTVVILERTRCIGVVDPFLSAPVRKGERFWIFLYPGTVTSLRHVWTHSAFSAKAPTAKEPAND